MSLRATHISQTAEASHFYPRLTVVIVNYNGWDDVRRLVSQLAQTAEVREGLSEVVVVDNASDGPIPREFAERRPGIRLIARRENGGFAAGVNTGWRASQSPWVLVLNPDVVVEAELLGQVLARVDRIEREGQPTGVVGFSLRNADGSPQPSVGAFPSLARSFYEQLLPRSRRKYQAGWRTQSGPVAWVTGACLLLNSRMLAELGGMDEEFFLYYEEVALCKSAQKRGWQVHYDASVQVTHLRPLQTRPVTPHLRVITRHSKMLYFRKHLPRWQFVGLTWVVKAEAALRALLSARRGHAVEHRAWRAIGNLATAMHQGAELRGVAVRMLAESVARAKNEIKPPAKPKWPSAWLGHHGPHRPAKHAASAYRAPVTNGQAKEGRPNA